jgi:hypothetical protein
MSIENESIIHLSMLYLHNFHHMEEKIKSMMAAMAKINLQHIQNFQRENLSLKKMTIFLQLIPGPPDCVVRNDKRYNPHELDKGLPPTWAK